MTSWRIDLTVFTDLSASIFAACFMILLIFLSLAQTSGQPARPERAIEGTRDLELVRRRVLAPAEMVDLLRAHGGPGVGIDIFSDRIEVHDGSRRIALQPPAIPDGLVRVVNSSAGPARLYVFSNGLYGQVLAVLARSVQPRAEISVPRALRDADRPDEAWSARFLELGSRSLAPDEYRAALAVLLEGGTGDAADSGAEAGGGAASGGSTVFYTSLLLRVRQWLAAFAAIVFPATGFLVVAWIERRRWRREAALL